MANDLAAMITRIAAEMSRPDFALTGSNVQRTRDAIATAITEYQKQRFRFSDINPSAPTTFVTVPGQSVYPLAGNSNIATIMMIDYINIVLGNSLQQLGRVSSPEAQHLNIQLNTSSGFPSSYAYEGNALILYPVPDQVYTLIIGGHLTVAAPAADDEANNPWMTSAELLIRCRAKYELYSNLLRNDKEAARFSPDPGGNNGKDGETYRAWKSLKGEGNKITGSGRIRPMAF